MELESPGGDDRRMGMDGEDGNSPPVTPPRQHLLPPQQQQGQLNATGTTETPSRISTMSPSPSMDARRPAPRTGRAASGRSMHSDNGGGSAVGFDAGIRSLSGRPRSASVGGASSIRGRSFSPSSTLDTSAIHRLKACLDGSHERALFSAERRRPGMRPPVKSKEEVHHELVANRNVVRLREHQKTHESNALQRQFRMQARQRAGRPVYTSGGAVAHPSRLGDSVALDATRRMSGAAAGAHGSTNSTLDPASAAAAGHRGRGPSTSSAGASKRSPSADAAAVASARCTDPAVEDAWRRAVAGFRHSGSAAQRDPHGFSSVSPAGMNSSVGHDAAGPPLSQAAVDSYFAVPAFMRPLLAGGAPGAAGDRAAAASPTAGLAADEITQRVDADRRQRNSEANEVAFRRAQMRY